MNFRQPPKSPPEPAGANEPALQQAIFALGKGQLKEAELLAADFLKRNPTDPRVLQIFGSALLLQGEAERAIAPLAQAARRTHDPAIEMQAAMAMSKAGHSESALEWLERATKRRPAFPPAFHVYGTMLASLDRLDEAIDVTRHGLALMPDVADFRPCSATCWQIAVITSARGRLIRKPSPERHNRSMHCGALRAPMNHWASSPKLPRPSAACWRLRHTSMPHASGWASACLRLASLRRLWSYFAPRGAAATKCTASA
jgi:tetratricopeptide (TPR) repeat protein